VDPDPSISRIRAHHPGRASCLSTSILRSCGVPL
jgi:hypothetical protein